MAKKKELLSTTCSERAIAPPQAEALPDKLLTDLVGIIENRKQTIYRQVNSGVVLTFWEVGKRVNEEILENERAEYGKQIVSTLSTQLQIRYGNNFELRSFRRMLQFAEQFSDAEIVSALPTQLSWSHIVELLPIENMEAKLYYAEEAANGNLSTRDLRHLIARKAYERRDIANLNLTSLSRVPFNTFKDPYLLDALDLRENFLEADLEKAIVRELEKFILEFGQGFSFIARQKRLIFNDTDYYADLVFFNRDLKRLVAVELKTGKFRTEYKAQMEMYLRLLNDQERREGEGQPIGILLCTSADRALVEYLELDKIGIAVAEFWARFPSKEEFERRIKEITAEASERLERRKSKSKGTVPKQVDYFLESKDDNPDED
ncbi:MAG: PDDEXK nuclease domain-containing protein [Clostridiales bacterium]|jgi:predicted nuclease of restriction endonuclease-like (RecB) superfamily|nr:PDDEXK nuclease domain-containing protein [Clostridiales bacterium]